MTPRAEHGPVTAGEPACRAARAAAVAFTVVAVAGSVPGLTTNLDRIELAGWESGALLLGIVRVSVTGNLVHLVMAGLALAAARSEEAATRYLVWGGAAYTLLSCHRFLVDLVVAGGRVPGQGVGEWLPVAAGLALVLTGTLSGKVSWSAAD
ncbi:MAG: DUF4383 domain-containing protein [Ornithinibacter sp.]